MLKDQYTLLPTQVRWLLLVVFLPSDLLLNDSEAEERGGGGACVSGIVHRVLPSEQLLAVSDQLDTHTDRQRQTYVQTERQRDRQTGRQTDRQTNRNDKV